MGKHLNNQVRILCNKYKNALSAVKSIMIQLRNRKIISSYAKILALPKKKNLSNLVKIAVFNLDLSFYNNF